MVIYHQSNNNLFKLIYQLLLLFSIIKPSLSECSRDEPILKNGSCKLDYCPETDFISKKCIINNPIIKTQWLNKIITIGDKFYRYINFGTFSNGDMIIETNSYPANKKRMFYGLKQNGRPLFTKNNNETSYYSINLNGENEGKFESEAGIISFTYNEKEYFFSVSKLDGNAEILDFENDKIYYKSSRVFASVLNISSVRHSIFPDKNKDKKNSYYFCFIGQIINELNIYNAIFLQKHKVENANTFPSSNTTLGGIIELNAYGKGISCFQSPKVLIYCLYLTKYDKIYFNLTKYENDFSNKVSLDFESNVNDENNFFKCINFKDEIIAIIYYKNYTNILYPIISFKEFNIENQSFENYFSEGSYISGIKLEKNFCNNLLLNDFIKLNKDKFVFSAISESKETLYIILINIFGNKKVKIRYYSIKIYELYHYKILFDLRINNYNNLVALASSYCPQKECNSDYDEHYSSLIIFSNPNSVDKVIKLEEYIIYNNINNFDTMEINLDKELKLENNIFGYVFSSITINDLIINGNYKIISSKNGTKEIVKNSTLELNENLLLKYIGNNDYYDTIHIEIKYYFSVTEPDLDIYNNYPEIIEGDNDELFEKEQYMGRTNNLKIILEQQLSSKCGNYCNLCYKNQNSKCLNCKYSSSINNNQQNHILFKECFDKIIDSTVIMIDNNSNEKNGELTEIITDLNNKSENIMEDKTYIITDNKTENFVNKTTGTILDEKNETKSEENTEIIFNGKSQTILDDNTQKIMDDKTDIIAYNNNEQTEKPNDKDKNKGQIKDEEKACNFDNILLTKYCEYPITEEELYELYILIKNNYINKEYNRNNTIFQLDNANYQISTHEDQKNSENINISSIDLGLCEDKLKNYYKIPNEEPLIIYKIDLKYQELHKTFVQYEVYNPINLELLDLSICKDTTIIINSPVQLNDMTSTLYDSLKESGFNLFNENDSFYNDVCSTYTSINKTDITLADRKQVIFNNNGNITLCQTGCELEYYNSKTRKAKCKCSPENNKIEDILDPSYIKFNLKMISDNFIKTLKNSNFMVLQCYKSVFDLSTIWSNIGRIYMAVNLLLSIIFMLYFYFKDSKNIDKILQSFLNHNCNHNINSSLSIFTKKEEKMELKRKKKKKKRKSSFLSKNKMLKNNKNNNIEENKVASPKKRNNHCDIKDNNILNNNQYSENSNSKINEGINNIIEKRLSNKENNINIINIKNVNIGNIYQKKTKIQKNKHKQKKFTIKKVKSQINQNMISKYSKINTNKEEYNSNNLNDYEIDNLEYKDALIIDKRTFSQYYWSLLKRKHLILFTFCPANDYNLISIKLCLFLMSFSLYFTITGFFFDNDTMHNIFIDNGSYNIISELPKILFSTLITSVINILLKILSLSEKNFLSVKHEKDLKLLIENSIKIKKNLKIKFTIFFILINVLLLLFLYFISCFCNIYPNTQIILFMDTIFSFCISMIYPFGFNLLPGIFRITALRASNKDKICLFKIGYIISLF